jgi:hypothetical protein
MISRNVLLLGLPTLFTVTFNLHHLEKLRGDADGFSTDFLNVLRTHRPDPWDLRCSLAIKRTEWRPRERTWRSIRKCAFSEMMVHAHVGDEDSMTLSSDVRGRSSIFYRFGPN